MTDHALALYGNRPQHLPNEENPRQFMWRAVSWVLVALVHVVLLYPFVVDQYRQSHFTLKPAVETILDLTKLPRGVAPPVNLVRPEVPPATAPIITTAPVIVVPPPNPKLTMPKTPADVLKAIGEALSCGAENFENLTQAERARCKHEPWIARKLPNGTIVLEAANPSPFAPTPQPKLSGADALRRQTQTAPPCPVVANAPCLDQVPKIGIGIPLN